jgi:hypothetical protein
MCCQCLRMLSKSARNYEKTTLPFQLDVRAEMERAEVCTVKCKTIVIPSYKPDDLSSL